MAAVLLKFGADPLLKCNPKNDQKIANGSELALPHPRTSPKHPNPKPSPLPTPILALTLILGGEHGQRPGVQVSRGVGGHRSH